MLRKISTTSIALVIAMGLGAAEAQSLRNADEPAEFPPDSYTGKQYVDSRGCVFVRAGFDGAVTWVPRVSRQRKVLCGQTPTFAKSQPAPAAPPVAAPTPAPAPTQVVTAPAPKPAPAAPVTAAPRVVEAPRVATAPVVRQVTPVRAPTPSQVAVATPRPAALAPARVTSAGTACPGVSAFSGGYLKTGSGHRVRCGPQAVHPGQYGVPGDYGTATASLQPGTVIRVPALPEIKPPPGYKPAFDDDRFNPNRGKQTREGFAQMRLVWTSGVPRRLVDQNTGRDVTGLFPGLRFPFINLRQQQRYVLLHGSPVDSGSGGVGTVTVATKTSPPASTATTAAPANGHRYVQVGVFSTNAKANAAAARMQKVGLPARLSQYRKNGKTYVVVLSGPYSSASQLQSALQRARSVYSGAVTRK